MADSLSIPFSKNSSEKWKLFLNSDRLSANFAYLTMFLSANRKMKLCIMMDLINKNFYVISYNRSRVTHIMIQFLEAKKFKINTFIRFGNSNILPREKFFYEFLFLGYRMNCSAWIPISTIRIQTEQFILEKKIINTSKYAKLNLE